MRQSTNEEYVYVQCLCLPTGKVNQLSLSCHNLLVMISAYPKLGNLLKLLTDGCDFLEVQKGKKIILTMLLVLSSNTPAFTVCLESKPFIRNFPVRAF